MCVVALAQICKRAQNCSSQFTNRNKTIYLYIHIDRGSSCNVLFLCTSDKINNCVHLEARGPPPGNMVRCEVEYRTVVISTNNLLWQTPSKIYHAVFVVAFRKTPGPPARQLDIYLQFNSGHHHQHQQQQHKQTQTLLHEGKCEQQMLAYSKYPLQANVFR